MAVAAQSGCTVYQSARRTLIQEPSEFSWRVDRGRSLRVYRQWADDAWAAERGGCPDVAEVDDYAFGFRDGFVDFVYAGGAGEPPPIPPRKFWNIGWRTPAGAVAAQQWFDGYRHGAQVARDGGYRMSGVVMSANARAMAASWDGSASQSGIYPEAVAAPSESLLEAPETLEYDGHVLPPPRSPAESLPAEEDPADPNLLDDTLGNPAVDSTGGEGVGEMPSQDAPPTTDSRTPSGNTPTGPTASNLFRRAILSAQVSNAADAER